MSWRKSSRLAVKTARHGCGAKDCAAAERCGDVRSVGSRRGNRPVSVIWLGRGIMATLVSLKK
jgi:hypothetical protein